MFYFVKRKSCVCGPLVAAFVFVPKKTDRFFPLVGDLLLLFFFARENQQCFLLLFIFNKNLSIKIKELLCLVFYDHEASTDTHQ